MDKRVDIAALGDRGQRRVRLGRATRGRGFSITLAKAGTYVYTSVENPAVFSGSVRVQGLGLPGAPNDLAIGHIPDQVFPDSSPSDVAVHPTLGIPVSRTRILLLPDSSATVAQLNAALSAAQVDILGRMPSMHWLLVGAAETPDLSALQSALQSLRSSPGIATAAMSPQVSFDALRPGTAIDGWTWDSTAVTSAGAPLGRDGSWGYTTSV